MGSVSPPHQQPGSLGNGSRCPDLSGILESTAEKRSAREVYIRALSEAKSGALPDGGLNEGARQRALVLARQSLKLVTIHEGS